MDNFAGPKIQALIKQVRKLGFLFIWASNDCLNRSNIYLHNNSCQQFFFVHVYLLCLSPGRLEIDSFQIHTKTTHGCFNLLVSQILPPISVEMLPTNKVKVVEC